MHPFHKDDRVEVLIRTALNEPVWFSATVLRSATSASRKTQIYVEFETLFAAATEEGEVIENKEEEEEGRQRLREYVDIADVRPAPPMELHRFFKVGELVEGFCGVNKGWRKAEVSAILENSRYVLSFKGSSDKNGSAERIVEEVEQWALRVSRDWDDGFWVPPFEPEKVSACSDRNSSGLKLRIKCTPFAKLIQGMNVEVKCQKADFEELWYPATIVKSLGNDKFLVEYHTLRTKDNSQLVVEEVDVMCIRPCPPIIEHDEPFECLAQVDVWFNNGWSVGYVSEVFDGVEYLVRFRNTRKKMVFGHHKLRPHQEWVEGNWVATPNGCSTKVETSTKRPKLRIKFGGITSGQTFSMGMVVEVKSDEQGYLGSLYTATVVGPIGGSKYLVEYQTLRIDDESELLKETAEASYIRPCPPEITKVGCYKMLEEVDAWYNDGWWVGLICRVLGTSEYAVYFWTSNEELVFDHHGLRLHQEWIDGKWTTDFRKKSELSLKSKLGKLGGKKSKLAFGGFCNGTRVEVTSDEEGYQDSWFPAVILRPIGNGKYLVEYQTLTTDDETELLKEEADAPCIRPAPPFVSQTARFKSFEEVDAWFNEGWWVGDVCKVTEDAKYMVYLRTTGEVLEFAHSDLRPHQDWLNQRWIQRSTGR